MVGDGQHHGEEEGVKDPDHEDGHHHRAITIALKIYVSKSPRSYNKVCPGS